jgi:hypothetical protein
MKKDKPKGGNRAYVEGVQAIRYSGAAGKHQNPGDRRARTRQTRLNKALREHFDADQGK